MKFIDQIENTINYDKSIDEQLACLSQFDNITEEEILELTFHFKSSEVGILIEYLGYEKLNSQLPSFLEFLQDANWPACGGAVKMLAKAGRVIVPEVKRIFSEVINDEIWHYWILVLLIRNWSKELIEILRQELIDLILVADKEGASIQSLRILKENELITENEVEKHYQYLLRKYAGDQYWIGDLNDEIKPNKV